MSWNIVPLLLRDFNYFDRQRDLFGDWFGRFNDDEDWRLLARDDAFQRFNRELERINEAMQARDNMDLEEPPIVQG